MRRLIRLYDSHDVRESALCEISSRMPVITHCHADIINNYKTPYTEGAVLERVIFLMHVDATQRFLRIQPASKMSQGNKSEAYGTNSYAFLHGLTPTTKVIKWISSRPTDRIGNPLGVLMRGIASRPIDVINVKKIIINVNKRVY